MKPLACLLAGGLALGATLCAGLAFADEPPAQRPHAFRVLTPAERAAVAPRPIVRQVVRPVIVQRPVVYRERRVVREVVVERPVYLPRPVPVYDEVVVERYGYGPPPFRYGPPPFRPRPYAFGPGFGPGYGPGFGPPPPPFRPVGYGFGPPPFDPYF